MTFLWINPRNGRVLQRGGAALVPVLLALLTTVGCATAGRSQAEAPIAEEINTAKALAHAAMTVGDYARAVTLLLPLSREKVSDGQLYAMLAEAYWKLGNHAEAVGHFEAALRLDYGGADIHLDLATMLMEMGKTGRALTEFDLAVRFAPKDPLTHFNYGLALYRLGRRDQAMAEWEQAYGLDDRDPRFAEALGIALSGAHDDRALEYFERAAEQGANSPKFHNNFGLLLQRLGQVDRAQAEFSAALEQEPGNAAYRSNLASSYMKRRRFEDAIPLWKMLIERDPERRAFRTYLGQAYYETHRFEDAVDLLEAWIARQNVSKPRTSWSAFDTPQQDDGPGLDVALDVLAMSLRALGRLDRAAGYMARAVALAPESTVHLINYGVILAEHGRIEAATAQWEKALQLDPGNAAARRNLSAVRK